MSDSQNDKIDDIFIIPPEEQELRAKRKAQLLARKQKNAELRRRIAIKKASDKAEEKRTIKNNKSDIDNLKQELKKIRESNNLSKKEELVDAIETTIKNTEAVDYNDPTIINAEKTKRYFDKKTDKKNNISDDLDGEKDNKNFKNDNKNFEPVEKETGSGSGSVSVEPVKAEAPKCVINSKLFKRRF